MLPVQLNIDADNLAEKYIYQYDQQSTHSPTITVTTVPSNSKQGTIILRYN